LTGQFYEDLQDCNDAAVGQFEQQQRRFDRKPWLYVLLCLLIWNNAL